jgi:hypothetical protein
MLWMRSRLRNRKRTKVITEQEKLERARLACRKWRANNPDKQRAACKSWEERNPHKRKEYNHKRRGKWNEEARIWRKNNPDYSYKKLGITFEQVKDQTKIQGGKCAICKVIGKLCVDHCHETGKFRGMLCRSCNAALGLLKEDFFNTIRAANYLKEATLVQD